MCIRDSLRAVGEIEADAAGELHVSAYDRYRMLTRYQSIRRELIRAHTVYNTFRYRGGYIILRPAPGAVGKRSIRCGGVYSGGCNEHRYKFRARYICVGIELNTKIPVEPVFGNELSYRCFAPMPRSVIRDDYVGFGKLYRGAAVDRFRYSYYVSFF